MSDASSRVAGPQERAAPRAWSTITVAAVILSAIGFVFAFASGLGLPFALAGLICGGVAVQRDRAARPWPLIALLVGVLGTAIATVLLVLAIVAWAPLLPALLFG